MYIFNRFKQPSILAYIVTGILIGPLVFGWVSNTEEIILLSKIGIAFLLFSVGISTDLKQLKKINVSVFVLPVINIILTFLLLMLLKNLFVIDFVQALYLSFILSFSSTMLVAKILLDNFEISSLQGKISIGILLVEDFIAILAIPILKDVLNFSSVLIFTVIGKTIILIVLAFLLNKFVYPVIIKQTFKSGPGFFLLSIGSCFLFILVSLFLNFDIAVGAFIGGLAISIFPYNLEISNKVSGLRNLLSMIFFVSLGMQLSFNFKGGVFILFLGLFLFVFLVKPLIHFFTLLLSGYGSRISTKSTIILTQVFEFSLILAMQGWILGQLTQSQYSVIIIITSLSMLLTPYLYNYSDNIFNYLKPFFSKFKSRYVNRKVNYLKNIPKKLENHIVIVGSDDVGEAIRTVMGRDINIPYVVVDQNPDKIIPLIKKKVNCVCGDINNEEVINSLRLLNAKAVILTLPRFDTIIRFLKTGKTINPKLIVYCRAENKDQVLKLYEHGADLVILPKVLESNFLLEKINVLISKGSDNLSSYKSPYIDYLKRDLK